MFSNSIQCRFKYSTKLCSANSLVLRHFDGVQIYRTKLNDRPLFGAVKLFIHCWMLFESPQSVYNFNQTIRRRSLVRFFLANRRDNFFESNWTFSYSIWYFEWLYYGQTILTRSGDSSFSSLPILSPGVLVKIWIVKWSRYDHLPLIGKIIQFSPRTAQFLQWCTLSQRHCKFD